jgi:methylated-DNA-[protein]-cysteine S-methyltransferase
MTTDALTLTCSTFTTPLGPLVVVARGRALCGAAFEEGRAALLAGLTRRFGRVALEEGADPAGVAGPLAAYLAGAPDALDALQVDPGGTPFQRAVWAALRRIPAGEVRSYAAVAREIGAPAATRAVGAACGRNPIALVVPCHRAIGSDGGLRGYAFGLERKRWLLAHEAGPELRLAAADRPRYHAPACSGSAGRSPSSSPS